MGGSDSYHGQAIATDRSGNTLCDPQSGYRRQRSTVSRGRTWSVSKVPPVSPHGRTDGELVLQRCAAVSSTTSYELRISSGGGRRRSGQGHRARRDRFRTPAAGNAATIWSVNGANRDLFSLSVAPQRPASRSGAPGSPPFKTLAKKSGGQLQDKSLHDNAIVRRGVAKTPVGVEDQPQSGLELRLAEIRCRLIDLLGA